MSTTGIRELAIQKALRLRFVPNSAKRRAAGCSTVVPLYRARAPPRQLLPTPVLSGPAVDFHWQLLYSRSLRPVGIAE
eukprot:2964963-Rhodomonas_salina.1